jgi:hypothetical protein
MLKHISMGLLAATVVTLHSAPAPSASTPAAKPMRPPVTVTPPTPTASEPRVGPDCTVTASPLPADTSFKLDSLPPGAIPQRKTASRNMPIPAGHPIQLKYEQYRPGPQHFELVDGKKKRR